jgi:hypothetical protein
MTRRWIRLIGAALAVTTVVATVAFLGSATTGVAAAPPAITHPARLPAFGGGTSATWSSANWSGYAEAGHYTSISASWTVPTVTAGAGATTRGRFGRQAPTSAWYSATWTGIDGFNSSNLIQAGTEQDYYGGSPHYSAWWEILPAAETVISEPVSPGDVVSVSIVQTPTVVGVPSGRGRATAEYEWTITLSDTAPTHPWRFVTTQPYAGTGSSAEWVVEAPEVNGAIAALADYGFPASSLVAGDFRSADVATTVGGPLVGAGLNFQNDAGTLIQNGIPVSTPGPPDPAATAFNALYGPTAPPAPSS